MTVALVKAWADDSSGAIVYYIDGKEIMGPTGLVPLAILGDYARGSIIIGGAAEWEDLTIGAANTHLESDGTDITWQANITLADDAWIGAGGGAGRLVFDTTPAPDQIEVTAADLYFATSAHGIIHVDGNVAGYILRADGTRYVPANPATTLPIAPVAQGDILIADGTPEWSILTVGAAAGYALVSTATTAVWDQTPTWTGLHTFAAGITLSGASGANNITVPDNVAIAVELLDAGGIEYLRLVTTNAQPVILFNEAGVDVDFHVEANGVADALQVRGVDGQITLGALGAGVVQSTAGGVLSSTAVPLVDIASYARGSIIRGGAADWEAYPAKTSGAALIGDGTDIISDLTPAWAGHHSFAAGITFNGASGVNNVIVPDNVALAIGLLDGGGWEYLRIVTTDAQPIIDFNSGTRDIDFHVEASGVADAFQIRGSDGRITLGALGAGVVQSTAGGILSSAAVPLVDLAGYAEGSLIIGGAADWEALAEPGAAGHALVSDGATFAWDQTPTWTGLHTFAAGITFSGASGANNVTIPDNLAIAVELLDAGGLEYLRIVSTNAQPIINFNSAAADVDFHVEASGVADALQIQGSDGQITLGVLGAGFVQSTAGGVLSSAAIGAGDLPAHSHSGAGQGGQLDWDDVWSDAVHSHANAGEGGQLDWDDVWSDAVHSHANAAEGGAFVVGTTDTDATPTYVFFAGTGGVLQVDAGLTYNAATDSLTAGDYFTTNGGQFGISGNELLTVNAAGTFAFTGVTGITVEDEDWIGIGAAAERIIFDTAGDIAVMGANFGIGTATPASAILQTLTSGLAGQFQRDYAVDNNSIRDVATLLRTYSAGAGANGIGGALNLSCETTTAGNTERAARIAWQFDDATDGAEDGSLILYVTQSGSVVEEVMRLVGATGNVFINDTSNANMSRGFTINQDANDDEAFACKSSDVAHLMTDIAETDTFGFIVKQDAGNGGFRLSGLTEGIVGAEMRGHATTANTVKGTGGGGAVHAVGLLKDGAGFGNASADMNIFAVRTQRGGSIETVAIIDEDGDLHLDAGAGVGGTIHGWVFDEYDDGALLHGLRASLAPEGHELRERFGDFIEYARPVLEAAGVVHYNDGLGEDGRPFVSVRSLNYLLVDAVRQLYEKCQRYELALDRAGLLPEVVA